MYHSWPLLGSGGTITEGLVSDRILERRGLEIACWGIPGRCVINFWTNLFKSGNWADKGCVRCLIHSSAFEKAIPFLLQSLLFVPWGRRHYTQWRTFRFFRLLVLYVLPFLIDLMIGDDIEQVLRLKWALIVHRCFRNWLLKRGDTNIHRKIIT